MAKISRIDLPIDVQELITEIEALATDSQSVGYKTLQVYRLAQYRLSENGLNLSLYDFLPSMIQSVYSKQHVAEQLKKHVRNASHLNGISKAWGKNRDELQIAFDSDAVESTSFLQNLSKLASIAEFETVHPQLIQVSQDRVNRKETRQGVSKAPWLPVDVMKVIQTTVSNLVAQVSRTWCKTSQDLHNSFDADSLSSASFMHALRQLSAVVSSFDRAHSLLIEVAAKRRLKSKGGKRLWSPRDVEAVIEIVTEQRNRSLGLATPSPSGSSHVKIQSPLRDTSFRSPTETRSIPVTEEYSESEESTWNRFERGSASADDSEKEPDNELDILENVNGAAEDKTDSQHLSNTQQIDNTLETSTSSPSQQGSPQGSPAKVIELRSPSTHQMIASRKRRAQVLRSDVQNLKKQKIAHWSFDFEPELGRKTNYTELLDDVSDFSMFEDDSCPVFAELTTFKDDLYPVFDRFQSHTPLLESSCMQDVEDSTVSHAVHVGANLEALHKKQHVATMNNSNGKSVEVSSSELEKADAHALRAVDAGHEIKKKETGICTIKTSNIMAKDLSSSKPVKKDDARDVQTIDLSGQPDESNSLDYSRGVCQQAIRSLAGREWVTSSAFDLIFRILQLDGIPLIDISSGDFNIPGTRRRSMPGLFVTILHHKSPSHWSTGFVDVTQKQIWHYDCDRGTARDLETRSTLINYIESYTKEHVPDSSWQFIKAECPQQPNNWDCGVYALVVAACRLSNIPIPTQIDGLFWRMFFTDLLHRYTETFFPRQDHPTGSILANDRTRQPEAIPLVDKYLPQSTAVQKVEELGSKVQSAKLASQILLLTRQAAATRYDDARNRGAMGQETAGEIKESLAVIEKLPTVMRHGCMAVWRAEVDKAQREMEKCRKLEIATSQFVLLIGGMEAEVQDGRQNQRLKVAEGIERLRLQMEAFEKMEEDLA